MGLVPMGGLQVGPDHQDGAASIRWEIASYFQLIA